MKKLNPLFLMVFLGIFSDFSRGFSNTIASKNSNSLKKSNGLHTSGSSDSADEPPLRKKIKPNPKDNTQAAEPMKIKYPNSSFNSNILKKSNGLHTSGSSNSADEPPLRKKIKPNPKDNTQAAESMKIEYPNSQAAEPMEIEYPIEYPNYFFDSHNSGSSDSADEPPLRKKIKPNPEDNNDAGEPMEIED